jgi:uncharacterized protein (DUF305 family)
MESKNQAIIIGLLALITGLIIGYFFSENAMHRGFFSGDSMYEEMKEHMYGDEIVDNDGELQHLMSEMMLIGRGQTGEKYEEAFLRGMITHHLGAVAMSEKLLEQTSRPELIELAGNIIESQSAEVEMMKGWLNIWFNKN